MTREQARAGAVAEAAEHGIEMAVTFEPYSNEYAESDDDRFGYMPADAGYIFKYAEIVEKIQPPKEKMFDSLADEIAAQVWITCERCNGSGQDPHGKDAECYEDVGGCDGAGRIRVE